MANLKIDGKSYDLDTLSQEVKGQLAALRQCDQKINSWNMDIAIAQTARSAYAAELNLLLEDVDEVGAEKVEEVEVEKIDEVKVESAEEVDEVEVLEAEEVEDNG